MILQGSMPSFNVEYTVFVDEGRAWEANDLLLLMRKLQVVPDGATYNLVIEGFLLARFLKMAKVVYSAIHGKG